MGGAGHACINVLAETRWRGCPVLRKVHSSSLLLIIKKADFSSFRISSSTVHLPSSLPSTAGSTPRDVYGTSKTIDNLLRPCNPTRNPGGVAGMEGHDEGQGLGLGQGGDGEGHQAVGQHRR
jgi:hypothetical protein